MLMLLSSIAQIKSGFTFREAVEPNDNGSMFVIQANHVMSDQEYISPQTLLRTSFQSPRSAPYVQKGDIILVARGVGTFRSALFDADIRNVIPSSSVFDIRVMNTEVLPEYVSLFINSSEGQKLILQTVSGSNVQTISRKELEKIDIPIPPLIIQKGIVSLARNIRQQEAIMERKKELKRDIINTTIKTFTHN
jgi:restriction endonuclease S subunit